MTKLAFKTQAQYLEQQINFKHISLCIYTGLNTNM